MATTPKLLLSYLEESQSGKSTTLNGNFDILDAIITTIGRGLDADKGAPGAAGRLWIATDTGKMYYDDGATWQEVLVGSSGSLPPHDHASPGDGGVLTNPLHDARADFLKQSPPAPPPSGYTGIYADSTTGNVFQIKTDGSTIDLAQAGGGGGSTLDHDHTGAAGGGGALSGALVDSFLRFLNQSGTIGQPAGGSVALYSKTTDKRLYFKDDTNTERHVDLRTASELVNVAAGNITATDVQAALNQLDAIKAAISHTHAASTISNAPSGTITATDVQAALNQLDSLKAAITHTHASTAITHSPSGGIAATNVGAALVELDGDKLAALNGIATSLEITNFAILDEQASHPTAVANKGLLYTLAADKHVYLRDSAGQTYDLTLVGSGGGLTAHGHTGSTDGGVLTAPQINGYIEVYEGAAPGQPSTGRGKLYAKGDHHVYWKDQSNIEYDLTATGGASVWTSSGGLIYPTTITDRMSIGSLAASVHSLRVLKSGNTGTQATPEAPVFVDQTITSVSNPAPDIGAINAIIRYQAVAGGGVADLASTGLHITAEYGSSGVAATGTQHAGTFVMDVLNSSSVNNEVAGLFTYARSRHHTTLGAAGPPISLWGIDCSVHGPIGTQAGAIMGPVVCINKYAAAASTRCEEAGLIIVTRQGQGAGAELGHSSAATFPIPNGIVVAGTSTSGVGFNTGVRIGNPIGSVNANASPWFPSGSSQVGIGLTMNGLTQKAILLDGGNTRVQWGQDAAASVAWLDLSGNNVLQLDGRFKVTNGSADNGTVPLVSLGSNVAANQSVQLFNSTGTLTMFTCGVPGNFLTGSVLGDVGFVTGNRLLVGATVPFLDIESANRRLGVGTASPASSTILHVAATDRAVRLCPMTGAQFDAIPSKGAGDFAFITNATPPRYEYYDGTSRVPFGAAASGAPADHNHTATAGDGGPLTNTLFDGYEDHAPLAAPAAPTTAGYQRHYHRTSDSLPLYRDTAGVDYPGSLQPARRHLRATTSYDPPNLAHGAWDTVDVTCAGAVVGDNVLSISFSVPLPAGMAFMQPSVFSTNVVRGTLVNMSGTNQDVGAGTVSVCVLGYS